ncbi:MAG: TlpA family protein disulfide reductase [Xanthomonadales bacterium]|nr:TlpA family protein disulfide reductase [Xanthomonadales bacterium]
MRLSRWILSLLLSLSLLGLTPALQAATDQPALSVQLVDGTDWSLADQRGQWVVVNYWATWCTPCIKEMPELQALHDERDDVLVIGLAYEESELDDIRRFLEVRKVSYPIAQVDVFAPPADFDTPRGLPMTYLIDPAGTVAEKFLGPITREELEQAIAKRR